MIQGATSKAHLPTVSSAQAWARALELTAPIARHPDRVFPEIIEERAAEFGAVSALLSDSETLTYADFAERINRYARWALDQDLGKGDSVALLMSNRPEYLAIWLGIIKVGGVVALLNTNLVGASLAHSVNIVAPKHLIVAAELTDRLSAVLPYLVDEPAVWVHGPSDPSSPRIDIEIEQHSGEMLTTAERRRVTIDDPALYIYTSGTTGLPKAANVTHGRLMQSSLWFCGMMGVRTTDRVYNCLPMYHTVGGVQVPGAVLAGGGSVVIRERFSSRTFWSDVVRSECSLIQYIGELCRYLLHTDPSSYETEHQIRMACGNGLAPDIWRSFQSRFRIPRIFEFYGSTEGNVSLFNIEGEPGSVGRIPSYLAHRFPAKLVKVDTETGALVRTDEGACITCAPNEVGEAIGEISKDPSNLGTRFDGYTSKDASEKKILRNAFRPGDAWFRTGDLMRKDERGFFYFVDRIGDTFRWKGENVSTSEVSEVLCAFPGVKEANVYGVAIPGTDGRAGMATLAIRGPIDLRAFWDHLSSRLPEYARPLFLRICNELELTSTFKYTKSDLVRQAYNPFVTTDPIYFNDGERGMFVRVDHTLFERIQHGLLPARRASSIQAGARDQPEVIENAMGLSTSNARRTD